MVSFCPLRQGFIAFLAGNNIQKIIAPSIEPVAFNGPITTQHLFNAGMMFRKTVAEVVGVTTAKFEQNAVALVRGGRTITEVVRCLGRAA